MLLQRPAAAARLAYPIPGGGSGGSGGGGRQRAENILGLRDTDQRVAARALGPAEGRPV